MFTKYHNFFGKVEKNYDIIKQINFRPINLKEINTTVCYD